MILQLFDKIINYLVTRARTNNTAYVYQSLTRIGERR